jgi:hypothetical protein
MHRPSIRLIADTAYGTGPLLGWLVDRKIAPHIPVFDKSGRNDGTWTRADFEWDAQNDQYIFPEGHELKQFRRNYSDPNRGPTGKGIAKYRGLKNVCQACPSKSRCCPNMEFRSITREEHEDARQVARDIAKTRQYEVSMKLRKKVETLGAAPITWSMRRERRIPPRRHRPEPPETGEDLSRTAANAKRLIRKARAAHSISGFLRLRAGVFPRNRRKVEFRGQNCSSRNPPFVQPYCSGV